MDDIFENTSQTNATETAEQEQGGQQQQMIPQTQTELPYDGATQQNFGNSNAEEQQQTQQQPEEKATEGRRATDERPTISVVIDEDEKEVDEECADAINRPAKSHYQDDDYLSDQQKQQSVQPVNVQQKLDFPVLHGLDLDDSEEGNVAPMGPRVHHQMHSLPIRRLPVPAYGYGGPPVAYHYKQQPRMGRPVSHNYSGSLVPRFVTLQRFPHQRQEMSRREGLHQLPPTLRPSAGRSRPHSSTTSFAGIVSPIPSSIRATTHSLPPPILQRRSAGSYGAAGANQSPYLVGESGLPPAPIVVPRVSSVRGRQSGLRHRQNSMQLMNKAGGSVFSDHGFDELHPTNLDLLQRGYEHDEAQFVAPPPNEPQPGVNSQQQRKTDSASRAHGQSHSALRRVSPLKRNTFTDAMEEEEIENEKFFSQQRQKAPAWSVPRGRRSKKVQKDDLNPAYLQQQQDSSKPSAPEDPFPCQQQQQSFPHQLAPSYQHPQQHHYESSIDSAIDSVVRGDALVMQQHFVPTASSPMLAHLFQSQSPTASPTKQQQSLYGKSMVHQHHQAVHHQQQMSHQSQLSAGQNSRLEDLVELAQASSHLLQQTTSSSMRTPYQQQQQQFMPPQQTLHFKVVATDTLPETLLAPPESRQQVFTVQQQQQEDQAPFKTYIAPEENQQHPQKSMPGKQLTPKPPKKLTKRQMETIQQEAGQILPIGSDGQGATMQEKTNARGKNKSATEETITQQTKKVGTRRTSTPRQSTNQNEKSGERPSRAANLKKNRKEAKTEKWIEGEDYVTRCICGMKHTDPFMIQCDQCDVWQHGVCMGIAKKAVPDQYFCEKCHMRELKLSAIQAATLQKRNLTQLKAKGKMQKMQRMSAPFTGKTPKIGIRGDRIAKKKGIAKAGFSKSFTALTQSERIRKDTAKSLDGNASFGGEPFALENHYSRGIKAMMAAYQGLDSQINRKQLDRIKNDPITRQMYVAPNVEGLVATPGNAAQVFAETLLIEYNGLISLLSEVRARTPNRLNQHNFTLIYSALGEGNEIFVDASKIGSISRSARRSCRPNAMVQHAFLDGKLRIFLYAVANIDRSTEVTIPFDFDFWESKTQLECACGLKKECPVQEFNEALKDPINFQNIKMAKNPKVNRIALKADEPETLSLSAVAAKPIKAESNSSKKDGDEKGTSKELEKLQIGGRNLRPRNVSTSLSSENLSKLVIPPKRTRLSIAASQEKSSPELGLKSVVKVEKQTIEETKPLISTKSSQANPSVKPNGGLALLAKAYRRSAPGSSSKITQQETPSSTPRRGRPPKKAIKLELLEQPNQEVVLLPQTSEKIPQSSSREDRKIQAAIAIVESIEREKDKKRKSSLSNQLSNDGSSNKKLKMVETSKKVEKQSLHEGKIQLGQLCDEFAKELRNKIKTKAFKLPSEYERLKAKYAKETGKKKSPRKKEQPMNKSVSMRKLKEEIHKSPLRKPKEEAHNKTGEEEVVEEGNSSKMEQYQKPIVQAKTGDTTAASKSSTEAATEAARPPNTKAMKKITIDEYKRKRMAEKNTTQVDNKQSAKDSEESGGTKMVPPIRQSPRKSFIPQIGSIPSPPIQQLEDFPSLSPPTASFRRQMTSPSIDELKKRILGNSGGDALPQPGFASSSFLPMVEAQTSSSVVQQQQHLPLPDAVPSPPQRESRMMSLDDRLRARFGSSAAASSSSPAHK